MMLATSTGYDVSALTQALTVDAFGAIITQLMPIIGVAVLVGFLFYVTRYAIGLFRGI